MKIQSNELNQLLAQIEKLEKQNEKLRLKLQKQKGKPSPLIGSSFLCFGILIIGTSIFYESSLLVFTGLAISLWGSLLLFIRPTRYIQSILLDSTVLSSLETLDQTIKALEYKGKAIYLPPKFIKESKGEKVFIPKKDTIAQPPMKRVETQKVFTGNPNGIYLTPPGVQLANVFEEELGKNFAEVSLNYIMENLPKVFVENLELARNCEITYENNMVTTEVTGVSYSALCKRLCGKSKICNTIGCPFCSAIVCSLTRTIGKAMVIDVNSFSSDDETVNIRFKILGE